MFKYLNKLGKTYNNFFKKLNHFTIIIFMISFIFLRMRDIYFLRIYNAPSNIFWLISISIVPLSIIILIFLFVVFIRKGINFKRGLFFSGIFILYPVLVIVQGMIINKLTAVPLNFFNKSIVLSLVFIGLNYFEMRFTADKK